MDALSMVAGQNVEEVLPGSLTGSARLDEARSSSDSDEDSDEDAVLNTEKKRAISAKLTDYFKHKSVIERLEGIGAQYYKNPDMHWVAVDPETHLLSVSDQGCAEGRGGGHFTNVVKKEMRLLQ